MKSHYLKIIRPLLQLAVGYSEHPKGNSLDVYNVPTVAPTVLSYYRMDTGTSVTGSISDLSFFKDGSCFNCNVTLLFTIENFNSDNPIFIASNGIVKSAKNAIGVCTNGEQSNLSSVVATNAAYRKGLIPLISADGYPASISDIRGMTFTGYDCAGTHLKYTFNSDGTATVVDNTSTLVLSAEQIQSLFAKSSNITINGHTYVGSLHKFYSKTAITYAMVMYVDWNTDKGYIQLYY